MTLKYLAGALSVVINPMLLILILQEPLIASGKRAALIRHVAAFWGRTLAAMGIAVILAELGKKYEVWSGHPGFPSGHTTFAVSAATCLILHRGGRWAWLVAPLAILMMISLTTAGYHTADEVAGGTLLGLTFPLLVWKLSGSRRVPPRISHG